MPLRFRYWHQYPSYNKYIILQNEVNIDNVYYNFDNDNASPQNQESKRKLCSDNEENLPFFSLNLVR